MDATLTGQAATDALRVYTRLGAADARFDGRRVAAAVLTTKGRARLLVSTVSARIRVRLVSRPRSRSPRRRSAASSIVRRSRSRSGPDGPGRPETRATASTPLSVAYAAIGGTFRRGR